MSMPTVGTPAPRYREHDGGFGQRERGGPPSRQVSRQLVDFTVSRPEIGSAARVRP